MVSYEECAPSGDRMPCFLARYAADRGSLERCWTVPCSPKWRARLRAFLDGWEEALEALPFDDLTRSDRADWLLFHNLLERERGQLEREEQQCAEIAPLLPFLADLIALEEERRQLEEIDPAAVAGRLHAATEQVQQVRQTLEEQRAAPETTG